MKSDLWTNTLWCRLWRSMRSAVGVATILPLIRRPRTNIDRVPKGWSGKSHQICRYDCTGWPHRGRNAVSSIENTANTHLTNSKNHIVDTIPHDLHKQRQTMHSFHPHKYPFGGVRCEYTAGKLKKTQTFVFSRLYGNRFEVVES